MRAVDARIDGEFKVVHSEMRRLDEKIDNADKRLEEKIDSVDKRLGEKMDGLDERMDVAQRLTVVEGKVQELETRR